jgi:hypothetical protein
VPPDSLERWLLAILETWREVNPDSLIEPWDWYYRTGRPARALGGRISRARLTELNASVYRALGADLRALDVRYDLEPREGKTPVAVCTPTGTAGSTTSPSCCTRPGTRYTSPRSAPGRRSPTGPTAIPSPRRSPTSWRST